MKAKHLMLRMISLLLVLVMAVGLFAACNTIEDPNPGQDNPGNNGPENPDPGDTTPADNFTPILRFLVTSDLHLRTEAADLQSYDILGKLYDTAYAYSESQSYNKLDGIFFAGDFTQNGKESELQKFFDFVNTNTKEGTTVRAILGNHEFWDTGRYTQASLDATFAKYMQYGGYEEVDQHIVVGGYHFLILNMDRYIDNGEIDVKFSASKRTWLEAELRKAAADDPTGTKPIFVFQHMPANGTVNDASDRSGDKYLKAIFDEYPQVVDFSGHTHLPITDPRSVWQGGYTAINTGALAYLCSYIANHPNYDSSGVVAMNNSGGWASGDIENSVRNAGLYYFVEVNAQNEIRLIVYNIFSEEVLMTINIGAVGDPSTYTFTDAREYNSETPYFPTGASLTVAGKSMSNFVLSIPQAICAETVNNYRCEVYQDNTLVTTVYRLACQYLGSAAPDHITAPITGLNANTEYTVKVIPVSTWGKEGTPLTITVKTASATADITPDIFSIKFNSDGTAINTLDGTVLDVTGNPTVTNDSTVGGNVGVFDGASAYRFSMSDYYDLMSTGFTFETYAYVSEIPSSGYVDIVSNQESGGFGFELKSNGGGTLHFYCHDGNGYITPGASFSKGQWVHLVGVYNKLEGVVKLYMNGVCVATSNSTGSSLKNPSIAAQYLCIGGDSDASTGGAFMTGKIAMVNIYSEALSDSQILELYNNCK